MREEIGFKEMWEYIFRETARKLIQSKDEEISLKDEEISEMKEKLDYMKELLIKYAPEDVIKDLNNDK